MAPSKKAKVSKQGDSDDEDYRQKRDRNNQAVKRSRVKSKQKANETKDRVDDLKVDNEKLQERINQKQNQLKVLKDLFLDTAKAKSESGGPNIDLQALLAESDDEGPSSSRKREH